MRGTVVKSDAAGATRIEVVVCPQGTRDVDFTANISAVGRLCTISPYFFSRVRFYCVNARHLSFVLCKARGRSSRLVAGGARVLEANVRRAVPHGAKRPPPPRPEAPKSQCAPTENPARCLPTESIRRQQRAGHTRRPTSRQHRARASRHCAHCTQRHTVATITVTNTPSESGSNAESAVQRQERVSLYIE